MAPTHVAVQSLISYLEHEPAPMIVLDTDYNILAANTAYQRQFATPHQQVRGQKCFRVSHQYSVPCDQAGEHCPMKQALTTRGPDRVLHIHHTPRGPEHVDVELRPILDDAGQVIAYVERLNSVTTASAQPREHGLVGRSNAFNAALSALQRAAPSQIPVLLQGESGTGKELFAQALHRGSPRKSGPLVVIDCTGLTEALFESEVFGHERGSFTGAVQRKIGLAEAAHGGTLFLDEIGDVPLAMQVKLLRLIESGTFRRVGGVETLRSDFRLVSATHKPLRQMVDAGSFRQDLYYRLSGFPIHIPALRDRSDDIPLIAKSLLQRLCGDRPPQLSAEASRALQHYPYPGNIRELRNILERAILLADDGRIALQHLALDTPPAVPTDHPCIPQIEDPEPNLSTLLATHRGSRSALAKALGISERTLYRRLKQPPPE